VVCRGAHSNQSQVYGPHADRRDTARRHSTGWRRHASAFATPACRRFHRTSSRSGSPPYFEAVRQIAHRYMNDGLDAAVYAKQRPGARRFSMAHRSSVLWPWSAANRRKAVPVDRPLDRRRVRQTETGSQGGPRDNPSFAAKPRVEAVAGKKCGASPSWTSRTSKRWKTCWPSTRSPTIPPNPSFAWMRKPISLHAEVRAPIPAQPGKVAKQDNEYRRCGTANVFGVVEPKGGRHFTTATPNRSGAEFARMVERIVKQYRR